MKRKLLILLSVFAIVLGLTACGNKNKNNNSSVTSDGMKTESQNSNNSTASDDYTSILSHDEAKKIAIEHAKVSEADILDFDIDLDKEKNENSYEIEFKHSGTEYKYYIHAGTGEILTATKNGENFLESSDTTNYKTKEDAKKIALDHAGVTESDVSGMKVEFDREDGVPSYEIEFHHGGYEYDYDIDAETGKILKSEKDKND